MRRFEVKNVSAGPRVIGTLVPVPGAGKTLVPGAPTKAGDNAYRRQQGPSSAIVSESQLRSMVGYFVRGQITVRPLDGGPVPDFLFSAKGSPVQEEKVVVPDPVTEPNTPNGSGKEAALEDAVVWSPAETMKGSIKAILIALEDASDEVILEALEFEREGKNRSTLIEALEAKLETEVTDQEDGDGSEGE